MVFCLSGKRQLQKPINSKTKNPKYDEEYMHLIDSFIIY